MSRKLSLSNVGVDCIIMGFMVVLLCVFRFAVEPYHRGFYCDDLSIRYPYLSSTITSPVLFLVSFGVPISIMVLLESLRTSILDDKSKSRDAGDAYQILVLDNRSSWPTLSRLYIYVGYFLFGAATTMLLTMIGKYSIGGLRPHFWNVCKPPMITCAKAEDFSHLYVTNVTCTGVSGMVREARQTFPSGHSSLSFYAAVYAVLYLQTRLWQPQPCGSRLALPCAQFLLLTLASVCALSRVSDYKHHWADVLVGGVLGSLIAVIVVRFMAKLFEHREYESLPPADGGEEGMGMLQ